MRMAGDDDARDESRVASDAEKGVKQQKPDIFVRDTTYADPEAIFRICGKPLDAIKDECLFVLDANTLLAPFRVGNKTLESIGRVLQHVAGRKQLVVPAQAAREFADQRAARLGEIFQDVLAKRQRPTLVRSPLLESINGYAALAEAECAVEKAWSSYTSELDRVLEQMRQWTWDDPVSTLYRKVFVGAEVVVGLDAKHDELRVELKRRYENSLPPGYKDKGKADAGVGDLLIWKTILRVAQDRKKSVVFVSADAKTDWWHRAAGQALYPRFELAAEFEAASPGNSFQIIAFARFLEIFDASDETVAEVRRQEERVRQLFATDRLQIERRLLDVFAGWLAENQTDIDRIDIDFGGFPNVATVQQDDTIAGFGVTVPGPLVRATGHLVSAAANWLGGSYRRRKFVFVVVTDNLDSAKALQIPPVPPQYRGALRDIELLIGYIDDERFIGVRAEKPQ